MECGVDFLLPYYHNNSSSFLYAGIKVKKTTSNPVRKKHEAK